MPAVAVPHQSSALCLAPLSPDETLCNQRWVILLSENMISYVLKNVNPISGRWWSEASPCFVSRNSPSIIIARHFIIYMVHFMGQLGTYNLKRKDQKENGGNVYGYSHHPCDHSLHPPGGYFWSCRQVQVRRKILCWSFSAFGRFSASWQ